jgi:hypothetical protein
MTTNLVPARALRSQPFEGCKALFELLYFFDLELEAQAVDVSTPDLRYHRTDAAFDLARVHLLSELHQLALDHRQLTCAFHPATTCGVGLTLF